MKKSIVCLLLVSVLLWAGCGRPKGVQEERGIDKPTAAVENTAASQTPVPSAEPAAPSPPASAVRLGYIIKRDSPDADGYFTLWVNDVIMVSWADTQLVKKYGMEDLPFDNDYEMYDDDDTFYPFGAFFDGTTSFEVISWKDSLEIVAVDAEAFLASLASHGSGGILAHYEESGGYIYSIAELYVP